jgi:hypothetical protein
MKIPHRVIIRCTKCCAATLIAALPFAAGCAGTALPNWLNPGPTKYQVGQAESYDPYPDPTIGPPIVGGRPIGYLDPRANPDPAKIKPPSAGMAPVYPAAAPVTYPPPAAYPPGAVAYPPVYVPAAQCTPSAAVPVVAAPVTTLPIAATANSFATPTTTGAPNVATGAALAPVAYGKALGGQ